MIPQTKHHLNDDMLMAYAAGTLPEAFSLMVAAHVSICDSSRAQLEAYESLGGQVLDQISPQAAKLEADSLEATFALIDSSTPEPQISAPTPQCDVLPQPVCDYVGGTLEAVHWRPMGMGAKQCVLHRSSEATARLLFIPAGAAMPDHGHHGTELTLVLSGAFQDGDEYFARGDVEIADSDMHHMPVADIHEDCICLVVTDAPLRFDGLIPRIAQRFLRI